MDGIFIGSCTFAGTVIASAVLGYFYFGDRGARWQTLKMVDFVFVVLGAVATYSNYQASVSRAAFEASLGPLQLVLHRFANGIPEFIEQQCPKHEPAYDPSSCTNKFRNLRSRLDYEWQAERFRSLLLKSNPERPGEDAFVQLFLNDNTLAALEHYSSIKPLYGETLRDALGRRLDAVQKAERRTLRNGASRFLASYYYVFLAIAAGIKAVTGFRDFIVERQKDAARPVAAASDHANVVRAE
jgi:hypothetical protein